MSSLAHIADSAESAQKKEHIDEFGAPVKEGEDYFRPEIVRPFHKGLKISKESMETLLHIVFGSSPGLREVADHLIEARDEQRKKSIRDVWNESDN